MAYEVPIAQEHINLEHDFTELCMRHGYKVADLSYHHNLPHHTANILRSSQTPASLYVRLSPDMLIVKDGNSTLCELKTGSRSDQLYVEAYQLMINQVAETQLNVPCLYIYRGDISEGNIVACHAKDICIKELVIPNRKSNEIIQDELMEHFCYPEPTRKDIPLPYSGDPYVVIPAEEIGTWQQIDKFIE